MTGSPSVEAAHALNEAWRALRRARDAPTTTMYRSRYVEAMDLVADAHQAIGIHPLTEETA